MENGRELRWYLSVLRRWWWLILICTLVAATAAYAASSWTQPVYSATTTLMVDKAQSGDSSDYSDILASERLANTYSQMLTSRPVLEEVVARLGLRQSPDALARNTVVRSVPDTQLIQVSVENTNPFTAAVVADTIAGVFVEQTQAQQAQRYAVSLGSIEEQMSALSTLTDKNQAMIDSLNATQLQAETGQARQESVLTEYRTDLRTIQQNYEDLRLAAAQAVDNVSIVEAAQMPENATQSYYTATVTLMVNQTQSGGVANASERLALTYGKMLTGQRVLEAAIQQLGLDESADSLAARLEVVPVSNTQLIELHVQDADAARSVQLANAIVEVFIAELQTMQQEPYAEFLADMQAEIDKLGALVEETQTQLDTLTASRIAAETELARRQSLQTEYRNDYRALQQDYKDLLLVATQSAHDVSVSETAMVPRSPIWPRTFLTTALAAAVGMMVGVGVAFLLEYLDDTIRTPEDVNHELGLSMLGAIGRLPSGEPPLVVAAKPRSPVTESFRMLLTNIRYSSLDQPLKTLMVTSPQPFAGKSFIVANLAAAAAKSGLRVVAVDADLRQPQLHRMFDLAPQEGLLNALLEGNLNGRLLPVQEEGLQVLCSGDVLPANPGELVSSRRMHDLLEQLAQSADLVLIDSPPVLPVADAAALAPMVDGVLLVLEAGHARRQAAVRAADSLHQVGARLVGVVLNRVPIDGADRYYHPGQQEEHKETKRSTRAWTSLRNVYRKRA
jgi:capsular exopolysaccharide synthesis family protein